MRIDSLTTEELLPCAVRTATATGSAVLIKDYTQMVGCTLLSSIATTGDTLDAKIQDSADGSTGWADVTGAAFTQVTASADLTETIFFDSNAVKAYVRAVGTIAGNGAESISFGVVLFGGKQTR
jgi:hypothetical protein